jgi:hypothetical protein
MSYIGVAAHIYSSYSALRESKLGSKFIEEEEKKKKKRELFLRRT